MCPLESEPGTSFLYSNAGFNTAGRIIEVLTGQSYARFLDERIFRPLGMHDTTFWPDAEQVGHLAETYQMDADDGHLVNIRIEQLYYPLSDTARRHPFPGGGLFSTARDLGIFYQMMLNDGTLDGRTYLTPASVREMTRRHTPEGWVNSQGLGFVVDGETFGHGGAHGTHTKAHLPSGLIIGWLMQLAATPRGDGIQAREAFQKIALERFRPGGPLRQSAE
jgi:CubicO group peptidase (beta-lactamase class C family)